MKKRHVVVSAEALADLDATFKFLSEDSPALALRIAGKLEEAAADLRTTALHYPIVVQRSDVPVRRRVVGSYNILFWVPKTRLVCFGSCMVSAGYSPIARPISSSGP
jgi:plasmid stabilization system protein ParE